MLIPVTGSDDLPNMAYLAVQLSNLGFASLGVGLLTHGLTLHKKGSRQ